MNDEKSIVTDLVVVEPDTTEEEKRSKGLRRPRLMAEVRALKSGDIAAAQDLLYKAAGMAARDKITPLQAQMLVDAVHASTGFKMEGLSKTFKKFFKTAQKEAREEAEAAAAAGGPGSGGAGGAGSAGWGPAGASSNASYAGAFGQYCLDEYGLFWRNKSKVWVKIASPLRDTRPDRAQHGKRRLGANLSASKMRMRMSARRSSPRRCCAAILTVWPAG